MSAFKRAGLKLKNDEIVVGLESFERQTGSNPTMGYGGRQASAGGLFHTPQLLQFAISAIALLIVLQLLVRPSDLRNDLNSEQKVETILPPELDDGSDEKVGKGGEGQVAAPQDSKTAPFKEGAEKKQGHEEASKLSAPAQTDASSPQEPKQTEKKEGPAGSPVVKAPADTQVTNTAAQATLESSSAKDETLPKQADSVEPAAAAGSVKSAGSTEKTSQEEPIGGTEKIEVELKPKDDLLPGFESYDSENYEEIPSLTYEWPPRGLLEKVVNSAYNGKAPKRFMAAAVSCNFLDVLDNWLASLDRIGLTNFIIVALDNEAYKRLKAVRPDNTVLSPFLAISNSATYGTEGFATVVRSRPVLLTHLLRAGYPVMYSDVDIVYNSNPFDEVDDSYDINAPTDSSLKSPVEMTSLDKRNLCTGLLYLKPTANIMELMGRWNARMIRGYRRLNQAPFNWALRDMGFLSDKERVTVNVLEKDAFPPGFMYFKNPYWVSLAEYKPTRSPVFVHNNYAAQTINKIIRFKDFGLWNPTGALEKCENDDM
mmetsp:Transcript_6408/g.19386  ORF Transcript_6408/g.19386 Transcript_6408/m.19386 type:complete len:541 (+) Transcript_6408:192-1814(+)